MNEYLIEAVTLVRNGKATEVARILEENAKLREVLLDFKENGLRADLNPTGAIKQCGCFEFNWWEYLKNIEFNVKEKANNALKASLE